MNRVKPDRGSWVVIGDGYRSPDMGFSYGYPAYNPSIPRLIRRVRVTKNPSYHYP